MGLSVEVEVDVVFQRGSLSRGALAERGGRGSREVQDTARFSW